MRSICFILCFFFSGWMAAQHGDNYDLARKHLIENSPDSARYYINRNLSKKPTSEDYFLSALIHEAEGKDLRALADYEAVIQREPQNLEAFFQKAVIYFKNGSYDQAIKDFSYVLENHKNSETRSIYYGIDPSGERGTFITTLQSMMGKVYEYRAMAYERKGDWDKSLHDFTLSFQYDTTVEAYINRSQVLLKMGNISAAITDLKEAIGLDSLSYRAWYNLILLDSTASPPELILQDESFVPMLNLLGANAYETGRYAQSVMYYTKAISANPKDDLALVGRGKAWLRMAEYDKAKADFLKALELNPARMEVFYLIGNALFYERDFEGAVGFYEQYLTLDDTYENVWFNAAMAYLSMGKKQSGCDCLKRASNLGMAQARKMLDEQCKGH